MKTKKGPSKSETVKVAIRVRPMNQHEIEQNSKLCVEVETSNNTVSCTSDKNETKTFQFDYVYPMETTQKQIYDEVAFPIVDSIFEGYNGTIFAYGQTGCGKTYTMMGIVNDENLKGIIPNAFSHIFGFIKTEESKKFLIRCSFVEIYNEEVRDLLGNKNQKLKIREDKNKGTFVKNLTYVTLKNTQDIENCLEKGNKNRHVGATSMNDQSSRSHSLFTVYVEIEEKIDDNNKKLRSGKLNLVDLAGSERVGKTNATGQTFDEGKKINLSLTALGSVIDALASNRKHIPYKDSKLTRLLADSLGGNTKTVMFANISPASFNYEETVGTLRYASRAKLIKNAPKINEDPKDALLRKYEEEIKKLKEALNNKNNNIMGNVNDNYNDNDNDNNYNNNNYNNNDDDANYEEKKLLLKKIEELENDLIDNKKLEDDVINNEGKEMSKEEIEKKIEEDNQKFKEYREQQLKQNEEMEIKIKRLEQEKKEEEELLKNDVDKLQQKLKELTSEIEDLKSDNSKDRNYYMEDIKAIYRDSQLYKEIIKYLLTDSELQKIIDLSKFNEENEKWSVVPFWVKEKILALPNVKFLKTTSNFKEFRTPKNKGSNRYENLKKKNEKIIKTQAKTKQNDQNEENNNNNDLNDDISDDESYEEDEVFEDNNVIGACGFQRKLRPIKLKIKLRNTNQGFFNNNSGFNLEFNNIRNQKFNPLVLKDKNLINVKESVEVEQSPKLNVDINDNGNPLFLSEDFKSNYKNEIENNRMTISTTGNQPQTIEENEALKDSFSNYDDELF